MAAFSQWFREHPAAVGVTYGQHCRRALRFGLHMIVAGIACVVHGICPFLFTHTASEAIGKLSDELRRDRR